jgi:hypothetical protein
MKNGLWVGSVNKVCKGLGQAVEGCSKPAGGMRDVVG